MGPQRNISFGNRACLFVPKHFVRSAVQAPTGTGAGMAGRDHRFLHSDARRKFP